MVDSGRKSQGPQGCNVRQAAPCTAAGRETDCDGVVAGRAATFKTHRVRRARGVGVLSLGRGGEVYG